MLRYAPLVSAVALSACFVEHGSELPADFSTCTSSEAAEPVSVPRDRVLTYFEDAKPIIDAKCAGCHLPDGIAPFPLTTYEEVFRFHESIRFSVETETMPPWHPDECCTEYLYDRSLSAQHKAIVLEWLAQGAQPGDPADEAEPLDNSDRGGLSRVDATIQMPEPFDPIGQIGVDELRCFLLDWPFDDEVFVTGLNVLPGNYSVVHHVILFVVDEDEVDDLQQLSGSDGRPGWDCYGELGARPTGTIGGWVPGTFGFDFPEGLGRKVEAGSKILLQVHYDTASRTPEPDQMEVELKVDESVEREAGAVAVVNPQWLVGDAMKIEAGSTDTMYHFKLDPTVIWGKRGPIELFNANIHMHEFGKSASLAVIRADGSTECLLNVREFDFDWNGDYFFDKPVIINPGDQVYVECHFDNSQANQKIVNGEQQAPKDLSWHADGEMCAGILMMAEMGE